MKNKKRILVWAMLLAAVCGLSLVLFIRMNMDKAAKDPELSALIKVIDIVKTLNLIVDIDGVEYQPGQAWPRAFGYLMNHYEKGDSAESWIKQNVYRTKRGNIIYFKYPDGSVKPMRDLFLEELKRQRGETDSTSVQDFGAAISESSSDSSATPNVDSKI